MAEDYIKESAEFMADPPGSRWGPMVKFREGDMETISLLVKSFQNVPEECAGIYNWIHTRDQRAIKHIKKSDMEALEQGAELWLRNRIKGEGEPISNHEPFSDPAPINSYDSQTPRGVKYDMGTVTSRTLCQYYMLKGDPWGNARHPGWVRAKEKIEVTLSQLEDLRSNLTKYREQHVNWLLCEGFSLRLLKMLQPLRKDCEIWKSRASYYQADNINPQVAVELETIDGLEWECLMMYRLVPTYRLPIEFRKRDPQTNTSWFARADEGNVSIKVPGSDAGSTAKVIPVYKADIDVDMDKVLEETMIPILVKAAEPTIVLEDNTPTGNVENLMTKNDLGRVSGGTDSNYSPYGQVSPVYGFRTPKSEEERRQTLFAPVSALAPLHKRPPTPANNGNAIPPPNITPAVIASVWGGGAVIGGGSSDWDNDTLIRNPASKFSGKYLADQIPAVNMQKGSVDDLYRLGKIIQRYIENKNCDKEVLLDAIISKTQPNDINLAWLRKHFDEKFEVRKHFFPVYRNKILPFFDLSQLTERAVAYRLKEGDKEPARVKGAEYAEYMRPYLMLAKSPQDTIATENLMRSKFWNYLGMQVRQPFEDMLMKNNVDPYQLSLEGIVEALKAYSLAVGGEIYARPDVTSDQVILSVNVKEFFKTDRGVQSKREAGKDLGQGRSKSKPEPASVLSEEDATKLKGLYKGAFRGYKNWNKIKAIEGGQQVAAIKQAPTLAENIAAAVAGSLGNLLKKGTNGEERKRAEVAPPNRYDKKKNFQTKSGKPKDKARNFQRNETTAVMGTKGDSNSTNDPIVCYACGTPGHIARECQLLRDTDDPTKNYRRVCTNCKKRGHMFTDCTETIKGN